MLQGFNEALKYYKNPSENIDDITKTNHVKSARKFPKRNHIKNARVYLEI